MEVPQWRSRGGGEGEGVMRAIEGAIEGEGMVRTEPMRVSRATSVRVRCRLMMVVSVRTGMAMAMAMVR
jgi:hypothetical protein